MRCAIVFVVVVLMLVIAVVVAFRFTREYLGLGPDKWHYHTKFRSGMRAYGRGSRDGILYSSVRAEVDEVDLRMEVHLDDLIVTLGQRLNILDRNAVVGTVKDVSDGGRSWTVRDTRRTLLGTIDGNNVLRRVSISDSGVVYRQRAEVDVSNITIYVEGRELPLPLPETKARELLGKPVEMARKFSPGP